MYQIVQMTAKRSIKIRTSHILGLRTKIWKSVFRISCYELEDLSEITILHLGKAVLSYMANHTSLLLNCLPFS